MSGYNSLSQVMHTTIDLQLTGVVRASSSPPSPAPVVLSPFVPVGDVLVSAIPCVPCPASPYPSCYKQTCIYLNYETMVDWLLGDEGFEIWLIPI